MVPVPVDNTPWAFDGEQRDGAVRGSHPLAHSCSARALGGHAKVLELPVNRLVIATMLIIMVIGGIFAAAPAWGPFFLSEDLAFFTAPILGVAVAATAFAGLCLFIRCRYCRYRLFWHAVSKRSHRDSVEWFLRARQCPQCGHSTA